MARQSARAAARTKARQNAAQNRDANAKKARNLRGWIESIAEAFLIVLVLFLLCWPVRIQGESMEQTFFSGDRVCISRTLSFFGQVKRGDIVMCKIEESGHTENIIKRIIGIPGDEIVIQDGVVSVNGTDLYETYTDGATEGDLTLTLAKGMYFVLGDNRAVSIDSRAVGPIPKQDIIGKVIVRYYPFNRINLY